VVTWAGQKHGVDVSRGRFHDLRHTFATLQLAAGTNPKIVAEVLGHKDVAITLDRYSHALPTMQVEAMARLDAMLGRSLLDAPDVGEGEAPAPNLWLDDEPGASPDAPRTRRKGSYKGSSAEILGNKRPDPSVDRADEGEIGTAYRIPSETSHASQPRTPRTAKRHMRRMRQDR
jgi:hypothetical protein